MDDGTLLSVLPVARLGQAWGWRLEREENLPRVEAALARGQPIAVFQDAGRREWWKSFGGWPHSCERIDAWPSAANWEALLVISDRLLPPPPAALADRTLVYRPPSLAVGIACRRGVEPADVEAAIQTLFERHGLSHKCITALAASTSRKHEPGLLDFAEELALPFLTYGRDKLLLARAAAGQKSGRLGAAACCEPAALLAAGVKEAVVGKTLFRRLALAVARRSFA
jgi:cobalt-precorrin 5A hydrolase